MQIQRALVRTFVIISLVITLLTSIKLINALATNTIASNHALSIPIWYLFVEILVILTYIFALSEVWKMRRRGVEICSIVIIAEYLASLLSGSTLFNNELSVSLISTALFWLLYKEMNSPSFFPKKETTTDKTTDNNILPDSTLTDSKKIDQDRNPWKFAPIIVFGAFMVIFSTIAYFDTSGRSKATGIISAIFLSGIFAGIAYLLALLVKVTTKKLDGKRILPLCLEKDKDRLNPKNMIRLTLLSVFMMILIFYMYMFIGSIITFY